MTFQKPSSQINQTGAYQYKGGISSSAANYIDNNFPNAVDKLNGCTITGTIIFANQSSLMLDGYVTYETTKISSGATYSCDSLGYPDYLIFVANTSTTAVTITLPFATGNNVGRKIFIKDSGGSANTHNITINAQTLETVDGNSSITISTNYGKLGIISDGGNWWVIAS